MKGQDFQSDQQIDEKRLNIRDFLGSLLDAQGLQN
jgi:hypothetical protein